MRHEEAANEPELSVGLRLSQSVDDVVEWNCQEGSDEEKVSPAPFE